MTFPSGGWSVGAIIAIVVLILAIVLVWPLGQLPMLIGVLIAALAVSRLT